MVEYGKAEDNKSIELKKVKDIIYPLYKNEDRAFKVYWSVRTAEHMINPGIVKEVKRGSISCGLIWGKVSRHNYNIIMTQVDNILRGDGGEQKTTP